MLESEPEQERQLGSRPIFWSSREQKIWQEHILQRETCESMKQESLCSKFFHAQGMRCFHAQDHNTMSWDLSSL